MDTRKQKLLLSGNLQNIDNAIVKLKQIEGVEQINYNEYLYYEINEWASDYDVMVSIMNILEDEFGIIAEMCDDDDEKADKNNYNNTEIIEPKNDYVKYTEEVKEEQISKEELDEINSIQEKIDVKEEDKSFLQKNLSKIIEIGISIILIIVGFIFKNITNLNKVSNYIFIVAFAVSSYEYIFDGFYKIFKKQIFNTEIIITITCLFSVILGKTEICAFLMTFYAISRLIISLLNEFLPKDITFKSNNKIIDFINKWFSVITVLVALIISFVLPIFSKSSYSVALQNYLNKGEIILICATLYSTFTSNQIAIKCLSFIMNKNNLFINSLGNLLKLSKVKTVVFDKTNTLVNNENGDNTVRDNSHGAILELYDLGVINTVLLSEDEKDKTVKLRKDLDMKQSVSNLSVESKIKELNNISLENSKYTTLFVTANKEILKYDKNVVSLLLNDKSDEIFINSYDLSKIPCCIKLAKRFCNILKQNIFVDLLVKFAIIILGLLGLINSLYIPLFVEVIMFVLLILNSFRNIFQPI